MISQAEIFKLMERDTHRRFREDPSAVQQLIDSFYLEVKGAVPKALRHGSDKAPEEVVARGSSVTIERALSSRMWKWCNSM